MKPARLARGLVAPLLAVCIGSTAPHHGIARASYVVMIVMENRDYHPIIGSSQAPYINGTLVPEAALMTNSHAIAHPSQPNYVALFSGSTQGLTNDSCPHTLRAANAGEELLAAGRTFSGYSESMPSNGYTRCWSGKYARKHNPWVNFTNVPVSSNRVYNGFVTPPSTLTILVPNLCNDMHDCSTRTGDTWLKKNVPPILNYGEKHGGLFILTWDEAEPDAKGQNQIATLLIGPMVVPGTYDQRITHYSTLRTVEEIAGIACTGAACRVAGITKIWR